MVSSEYELVEFFHIQVSPINFFLACNLRILFPFKICYSSFPLNYTLKFIFTLYSPPSFPFCCLQSFEFEKIGLYFHQQLKGEREEKKTLRGFSARAALDDKPKKGYQQNISYKQNKEDGATPGSRIIRIVEYIEPTKKQFTNEVSN